MLDLRWLFVQALCAGWLAWLSLADAQLIFASDSILGEPLAEGGGVQKKGLDEVLWEHLVGASSK